MGLSDPEMKASSREEVWASTEMGQEEGAGWELRLGKHTHRASCISKGRERRDLGGGGRGTKSPKTSLDLSELQAGEGVLVKARGLGP